MEREYFCSSSLTILHSFLPCGFTIIIILSVFGPCAQYQDGMSEQTNENKQTNQQKTDVVAAMVMEDKSMAV